MSTKTVLFPVLQLSYRLRRPAVAQESRGTITGRVIDPSGAVVVGAEVRAVNRKETGAVPQRPHQRIRQLHPALPAPRRLRSDRRVHRIQEDRPLRRRRARQRRAQHRIPLEVGNATETRGSEGRRRRCSRRRTVTLGQVVEERQIKDLPIQAGNANELVLLTPGVVNSTNLRQRKSSFNSASSQFTTNGNALYSNEYTIDGVPDTFFNGGSNPLIAFQLPQNSVAEFKVQTSQLRFHRGPHSRRGSQHGHQERHATSITANCTSDMINAALDASTFFQNASGGAKPEYQDNRYGAAFGGPVRIPKLYNGRNKTFFFSGWEGNQWGKPTANIGTVPTAAERNGDFSALLALGPQYQIYDPATHAGRRQRALQPHSVPGQHHSGESHRPGRQGHPSLLPAPNTVGTAAGQNNYTRNTKDIFDYNVIVGRVDHNFSDKNRAFVRLSYDRYLETDSAVLQQHRRRPRPHAHQSRRRDRRRDGAEPQHRARSALRTHAGRDAGEPPQPRHGSRDARLLQQSALAARSRHPDLSAGVPQYQGAHQPLHRQLHRDILRLRQLQYGRRHFDGHRSTIGPPR